MLLCTCGQVYADPFRGRHEVEAYFRKVLAQLTRCLGMVAVGPVAVVCTALRQVSGCNSQVKEAVPDYVKFVSSPPTLMAQC